MVTNSKYSKDDEGHGGDVNDCFLLLFLLLLFEVGTELMKKKTLGKYPKQPNGSMVMILTKIIIFMTCSRSGNQDRGDNLLLLLTGSNIANEPDILRQPDLVALETEIRLV